MTKQFWVQRLMTDLTYQPPFGILGVLANSLVIEKKLNEIFDFRRERLKALFGELNQN